MTMQSTKAAPNEAPHTTSPGRALYQAREQRGMNTDEVARALNLSPRHIDALEADDYDNLPGPTYVRGYLRAYGQFLGLDADGLIRTYNAAHAVQAPTPDLGALTPPPQVSSNDRLVKLGTVVVAGLVFGLAVIWWIGREEPRPVPETPLASLPPVAPVEGIVGMGDPAPLGEQGESLLPFEQAPAAMPETGAATSPAPEVPAPGTPATVTPRPPPMSPPAAPSVAPPVTASMPPPLPAPRARLLIRTNQESWVDVRDARQVKLLYETLPPGRTVSVEGVPPINVFIGNADGVTIELNGQPYDVTQHRRGQVARFVLPATIPESSLLGP